MEERSRSMDGGKPGSRDGLRAFGALLLCALTPAATAALLWNLLGGDEATLRLAATAVIFAAASLVLGPILGTSGAPIRTTAAGGLGYLLAFALLAVAVDTPGSRPLAAGAALASFLVFTSGIAAASARLLRRTAPAVGLAGGLGLLCLATFHLGDPFLFWESSIASSDWALAAMHHANPLSGVLGDAVAMSPDWLHRPYMYEDGLTVGRFSAAGDLQLVRYAPWWVPLLVHGPLGAALLALAGFRVSVSGDGA